LARQPNVHSPGRYRVRLNPASPLTSLTGIPGVASAEALPDDAFRVTLGPGEPADALARRLVEQGLGLIELTPDRDDLEQVFFDILNGEQAA